MFITYMIKLCWPIAYQIINLHGVLQRRDSWALTYELCYKNEIPHFRTGGHIATKSHQDHIHLRALPLLHCKTPKSKGFLTLLLSCYGNKVTEKAVTELVVYATVEFFLLPNECLLFKNELITGYKPV